MTTSRPKILVIVGPTAVGKTSLSIALAQTFQGEVISADSRQVYRGIDLCSGKVTKAEMASIPHHLLDIADPMTVYTARDFKNDAAAALEDITSRHQLPIIAGGTFFYVDTLLGKAGSAAVPPNPLLREELEKLTNTELSDRLRALDSARAASIDHDNRRRLIRALEIIHALGTVPPHRVSELPYDVLTIGLRAENTVLHENIAARVLARLDQGMVAEVESLLKRGVTHERLEALGLECRYISRYLRKLVTHEEMVNELTVKIRQFAKRQMTWLKRDQSIKWFEVSAGVPLEAIQSDCRTWLQQ